MSEGGRIKDITGGARSKRVQGQGLRNLPFISSHTALAKAFRLERKDEKNQGAVDVLRMGPLLLAGGNRRYSSSCEGLGVQSGETSLA